MVSSNLNVYNSLQSRQSEPVVYGFSDVVCNSDYDRLENSLDQDPCLVYAWMVGRCSNIVVQVTPIGTTGVYPAPINDPEAGILAASECTCSRVAYNLLSACALCQNGNRLSWDEWSAQCTEDVTERYIFAENVPEGTALPYWSTLQTYASSFDIDVAMRDADPQRDIFHIGYDPSSSSNSDTTAIPSSSSEPLSTAAPESTEALPVENFATSNASQVVSVSVAVAVVAVLLVASAIGLWFLIRRRRKGPADDSEGKGSSSIHPILFTFSSVFALILCCLTTWASVAIDYSVTSPASKRHRGILLFLTFTSWWTLLGSLYFLLAFQLQGPLQPTSSTSRNGSQQQRKWATLQGHFFWLLPTWLFWMIGTTIWVSIPENGEKCRLHCTQVQTIPVFGYIEWVTITITLGVVFISGYWSVKRRNDMESNEPKRRIRPHQSRRRESDKARR